MSKKQKKWIIIVSVLVVLFVIGKLTEGNKKTTITTNVSTNKKPENILDKDFNTLGHNEKVQWIQAYAKSQDSKYSAELTRAVKNHFKYPEEVDFDFGSRPNLNKVEVTLPDDGISFISGFLTAKNPFGVKSKYEYKIRLIILPGTIKIDEIIVNEFRR